MGKQNKPGVKRKHDTSKTTPNKRSRRGSWRETLESCGFTDKKYFCEKTTHPNENVTVRYRFWADHELCVRIYFKRTNEIILVEYQFEKMPGNSSSDGSLSNCLTDAEFEKLGCLMKNLRHVLGRKEDLFPHIQNWASLLTSNYLSITFAIYLIFESTFIYTQNSMELCSNVCSFSIDLIHSVECIGKLEIIERIGFVRRFYRIFFKYMHRIRIYEVDTV